MKKKIIFFYIFLSKLKYELQESKRLLKEKKGYIYSKIYFLLTYLKLTKSIPWF